LFRELVSLWIEIYQQEKLEASRGNAARSLQITRYFDTRGDSIIKWVSPPSSASYRQKGDAELSDLADKRPYSSPIPRPQFRALGCDTGLGENADGRRKLGSASIQLKIRAEEPTASLIPPSHPASIHCFHTASLSPGEQHYAQDKTPLKFAHMKQKPHL
jgi:hypothetical protein